MFNVYSIENQNFYLNDSLISGVQGLGVSYQNNINTSLAIDSSDLNYFVSQPIIANVDLNYLLSSNDRFINYTGSSPFSGKIEYGNKILLLLYFDSDSWTLGWGDSVVVINSLDELTEENGYYTRL